MVLQYHRMHVHLKKSHNVLLWIRIVQACSSWDVARGGTCYVVCRMWHGKKKLIRPIDRKWPCRGQTTWVIVYTWLNKQLFLATLHDPQQWSENTLPYGLDKSVVPDINVFVMFWSDFTALNSSFWEHISFHFDNAFSVMVHACTCMYVNHHCQSVMFTVGSTDLVFCYILIQWPMFCHNISGYPMHYFYYHACSLLKNVLCMIIFSGVL